MDDYANKVEKALENWRRRGRREEESPTLNVIRVQESPTKLERFQQPQQERAQCANFKKID